MKPAYATGGATRHGPSLQTIRKNSEEVRAIRQAFLSHLKPEPIEYDELEQRIQEVLDGRV